jgi:hypothetical protein
MRATRRSFLAALGLLPAAPLLARFAPTRYAVMLTKDIVVPPGGVLHIAGSFRTDGASIGDVLVNTNTGLAYAFSENRKWEKMASNPCEMVPITG